MTDFDAKMFSIPKWSPCLLGTVWRCPTTHTHVVVVEQDLPDKGTCEGVYLRGYPDRRAIHAFQPIDSFMLTMERVL
jgi:hypothetical protein